MSFGGEIRTPEDSATNKTVGEVFPGITPLPSPPSGGKGGAIEPMPIIGQPGGQPNLIQQPAPNVFYAPQGPAAITGFDNTGRIADPTLLAQQAILGRQRAPMATPQMSMPSVGTQSQYQYQPLLTPETYQNFYGNQQRPVSSSNNNLLVPDYRGLSNQFKQDQLAAQVFAPGTGTSSGGDSSMGESAPSAWSQMSEAERAAWVQENPGAYITGKTMMSAIMPGGVILAGMHDPYLNMSLAEYHAGKASQAAMGGMLPPGQGAPIEVATGMPVGGAIVGGPMGSEVPTGTPLAPAGLDSIGLDAFGGTGPYVDNIGLDAFGGTGPSIDTSSPVGLDAFGGAGSYVDNVGLDAFGGAGPSIDSSGSVGLDAFGGSGSYVDTVGYDAFGGSGPSVGSVGIDAFGGSGPSVDTGSAGIDAFGGAGPSVDTVGIDAFGGSGPSVDSGGGGGGGGGKIICTAMNHAYGFGSFRNAIWIAYADKHLTKAHEVGYHTLFLPLVDYGFKRGDGKLNMIVRKVLEWGTRHRSTDLRAELRGTKRDTTGRVIRFIFEPLCYAVGKLKGY